MLDDSLKNPAKERNEEKERREKNWENKMKEKKIIPGKIILPKNVEPFHSKSEIFPELEMSKTFLETADHAW